MIEVRSAKDRHPALQRGMLERIANGAGLAWLIEPQRRAVEVWRQDDGTEARSDPTSVRENRPVRAFELAMGRVWG